MPMGLAGAAGVGYLKQNSPEGPLCIALAEWYIGKTLFMVVGAMLRPLRTLCVVTKKPALGGLVGAQALRSLVMPRTMHQIYSAARRRGHGREWCAGCG